MFSTLNRFHPNVIEVILILLGAATQFKVGGILAGRSNIRTLCIIVRLKNRIYENDVR